MALCRGKREKSVPKDCNSMVYRCRKCGNLGCDSTPYNPCTQQGFDRGQCLRCGSSAGKDPV